jgi:hypothetical protein
LRAVAAGSHRIAFMCLHLWLPFSLPQRPRPTNKLTPPLIKPQQPVRLLIDPNPHADADSPCRPDSSPEPQHATANQIHSVQPPIHLKRLRQPSRSPRQILQADGRAVPLHSRYAFNRLNRAQQNSFSNPLPLPGNIQHEMIAVTEIHIRMPALQKQRPIPRRQSAKSVRRSVAGHVRFRFDDPPRQAPAWQIVHQRLANQKSRQLHRLYRQLVALQSPNLQSPALHRHPSFYHTIISRPSASGRTLEHLCGSWL